MRSKVVSVILTAVMVIGLVPAFAEEATDISAGSVIIQDELCVDVESEVAAAASGPADSDNDAATSTTVSPPEVYGYLQWVGKDIMGDPMVRIKRIRIYFDMPLSNDWQFNVGGSRAGGKWNWSDLSVGRYQKDWEAAFGISTTPIGWSVPPPHVWALITYPGCTDLPYTSTGVFGRFKISDATVRAAIVNGEDNFTAESGALSLRVELPAGDRSTVGVNSYHGNYLGVTRELVAMDFHHEWADGYADAFYSWENGDQPFSGGYWLVALGGQTKFVAECDYFDQPGTDDEWGYALGINHDLQTNARKPSSLRLELRDAGDGEWTISTMLQIGVN
jgi:hypothetical protein